MVFADIHRVDLRSPVASDRLPVDWIETDFCNTLCLSGNVGGFRHVPNPAICEEDTASPSRDPSGPPARAVRFGALSQCTICILLPAFLAGCSEPEEVTPPPESVLVISVDTLRRDHLGCYGYFRPTSPNIDALAKQGVQFENALSTCSWTLPSHGSMLTGLYPAYHGLQDDGVKLPKQVATLAERLHDIGLYTLAVVSHVYVSSRFGFERGFDNFDDSLIEKGAINPIAEQVVDRFLARMESAPRGPYFGFVHFFDPHWDYSPPPPYVSQFTDARYTGSVDGTYRSMARYFSANRPMPEPDRQQAIALYDGEIAYVDDQIGRLLKELRKRGRLDNTVVVFTADHGEEFKDHGQLGHARTLFGEQIRVPLIIAGHPRFPPGQRRRDPVSLVDLAPSLIELMNAKDLPNIQGHSIISGNGESNRPLFAESIRFGNEIRAARRGPFKMIHYRQGGFSHFFDLGNDPNERRPLKKDPTGGKISSAMAEYAAAADHGWHLKLLAASNQPIRCRAKIHTTARIVDPRRYLLQDATGRRSRFAAFEVDPDEHALIVDVSTPYMAAISFKTEPSDAPVTFQITVDGKDASPGVFLGSDKPVPSGEEITLTPKDARLSGLPADYARAPTGCYIRTVIDPAAASDRSELSEAAIKRLKALGYIGSDTESDD